MSPVRLGGRSRWTSLATVGVVIVLGVALGGFWWRRTAELDPLRRGRAAYSRGDYPAAEREARRVLKGRRDDADALRLLARSLFRQGRDPSALNLEQRLPRARLDVEDYFLQGAALFRLGQRERAILLWRAGLGLDRNHLETIVALEQAFSALDLLHEAGTMAQRLAAQPGWEARAALRLAAIRAEESDPAGTAAALERALSRPDQWYGQADPDRVRKQLVRCRLQMGQPSRARDELSKLTGAGDGDPERGWLLSRCNLQQGVASAADVAALARSYRQAHPLEPEPAPFVGEARCAECHPAVFRSQHRSRHARTLIRKDQLGASLPQPSIADPGDPRVLHSFVPCAGGWEIQTRAQDRVYQTVVDYAFGSGDRGLTLVGHDREDRFYEYRLSHYPEPFGWDVTSGHPPQPDQPALFQGMRINRDAVRRCLFCHATHPHAILTGSGPESSDGAIGCERCHGPAGHHVQAMTARTAGAGPEPETDLAIARPALVSGASIVALCSQCHSPRDPKLEIIPETPHSVRFQGRTLTWSRCYTESDGQLDCVTCHDPHRDAETSPAVYNARCLACHGTSQSQPSPTAAVPRQSGPAPRRSCPIQPAGNCITCHMPRVKTPMAHAEFTDHFIRVHRDGGRDPQPGSTHPSP